MLLEVKPPGPKREIVLYAIVPQFAGLTLTPPKNVDAEIGEEVDLPFTIYNSGNGEDKFTITRVDISKPAWKDNAYVVGGSSTGIVKPHYTTTKIVRVTVPYDEAATDPGKPGVRVSVQIESEFDPTKEDGKGTYVKVIQFWDITFNVDKVNDTVLPGSRVDFTFVVRNDGNGQDNITVNLSHQLNEWSLSVAPQNYFNITKGVGRTFTLSIIPPETTIRGEYWITVIAKSTGPPESPVEEMHNLRVEVLEVFNFTMEIDKNTTTPGPPTSVFEFEFEVINAGNSNDFVTLSIKGKPNDDWFLILDPEGVPLSPLEIRSVSLTVISPSARNCAADEYEFWIYGVSEGNSSIVRNVSVQVKITAVGEIDFEIEGNDLINVNPYEKEVHNFIFTLINKGNDIDEISLSVGGTSWDPNQVQIRATFYSPIQALHRYSETQVSLEVRIPKGTPLGYYDITVVAQSILLNPESTRTLTVHMKVIQEDVKVSPMKFKKFNEVKFKQWEMYTVQEGDLINIGIFIFNNGSEPVHDVNVRLYIDNKLKREENISSIGVLKTIAITHQWKADFVGEFNVKADAKIKGDAEKSDNSNTAKIKVVEDTGETNGPGQDMTMNLLMIVLMLVIIGGIFGLARHIVTLRREATQRELYESIYTEMEEGQGK
jgi:uncharacterized membrane protein